MRTMLESLMPRTVRSPGTCTPFRSVRPSLLDLRFTGDAWIVDQHDGTATVRLDNYRLSRVPLSPFDVPSMNQQFQQLRQWQIRRRLARQGRLRARQSI